MDNFLKMGPMTIGQIFDRTFRLYRAHFWTFVGIGVIAQILSFLAQASFGIPQTPDYPRRFFSINRYCHDPADIARFFVSHRHIHCERFDRCCDDLCRQPDPVRGDDDHCGRF